ncbi:GNAT family N-acetyltransferase [Brucellaceae bacterium C25G]
MDDEDQAPEFQLRVVRRFDEFTIEEWSSLAGASREQKDYNPFLNYHFLNALEQSDSASAATGWRPSHLRLETAEGQLLGAVPAYLKSHSQGEYVFDHGWADAYERAGGRYYPKLQICIPFTPATGPRLLHNRDYEPTAIRQALALGLCQLTDQLKISSAHVTFVEEKELSPLINANFLHRTDLQFHFINNSFLQYDDFLNELSSRKRKQIKKERKEALSNGITIDWLQGEMITPEILDQFFAFYIDTGNRKWGRPYLTRSFYKMIGETMSDDIVLIMAKRDDRYIAGAINFIGSDTLFGRHWGCIEDHPFLHFEVCYHQAIEYAIKHKLAKVEAGAQGDHKIARGYQPVLTHSAHYMTHEGLRHAVADYLDSERREVARMAHALEEQLPFRKMHDL